MTTTTTTMITATTTAATPWCIDASASISCTLAVSETRRPPPGRFCRTSPVHMASREPLVDASLAEDPRCIFIVRKINRLGRGLRPKSGTTLSGAREACAKRPRSVLGASRNERATLFSFGRRERREDSTANASRTAAREGSFVSPPEEPLRSPLGPRAPLVAARQSAQCAAKVHAQRCALRLPTSYDFGGDFSAWE